MQSLGNVETLKQRVLGMLRHIRNEHAWAQNDEFSTICGCEHVPLDPTRGTVWFQEDDPGYKAIVKAVDNPKFLSKLPLIADGLATSAIESANSMIADFAHKVPVLSSSGGRSPIVCDPCRWTTTSFRPTQLASSVQSCTSTRV